MYIDTSIKNKFLFFTARLALCKVFIGFFILAGTSYGNEKPKTDLIFELNARLIEESGIVHWFETKFPDLKKWAKEVENEYRSYVKIFKPIGLEKESFISFKFSISGLEELLGYQRHLDDQDGEFHIDMNLIMDKPVDLFDFFNWMEMEFTKQFGQEGTNRLLKKAVLDKDSLFVSIPLNVLDDHPLINFARWGGANLQIEIHVEKKGTTIFLSLCRTDTSLCDANFTVHRVLSEVLLTMPDDRQISFYCRLPKAFLDRNLNGDDRFTPFATILVGIEEVALSVSFRESSIFTKSTFIFSHPDAARAVHSMVDSYMSMAGVALSHDSDARALFIPLKKIQSNLHDHRIEYSLDLNDQDLEEMIALSLSAVAPPPPVFMKPKRGAEKRGSVAPDFEIPLIDGGSFKLGYNRGKVVILHFWSTRSGPSTRSFPLIIRALEPFSSAEIVLLAINHDEPVDVIKEFISDNNAAHLSTARDVSLKVSKIYDVKAMPHTVLIDQEGVIQHISVGFSPFLDVDLKKTLTRLLQ